MTTITRVFSNDKLGRGFRLVLIANYSDNLLNDLIGFWNSSFAEKRNFVMVTSRSIEQLSVQNSDNSNFQNLQRNQVFAIERAPSGLNISNKVC